jgi:hypothetical protein
VKPNINLNEVHPQLSNNGHAMDALVGFVALSKVSFHKCSFIITLLYFVPRWD